MDVNYLETLRAQLEGMALGFVAHLPSIAIAVLVLLLTWIVAKFALRIANRIVGRTHIREDLKHLVEILVKLGIWIVGILLAAAIVVPGLTPANLFAGLGIGALAIGFAFQDILENFLAGVLIMVREKMRIGDVIECEGILVVWLRHIIGVVEDLIDFDHEIVLVGRSVKWVRQIG